jgi:DNA-binding transcriptional regulator YiaG
MQHSSSKGLTAVVRDHDHGRVDRSCDSGATERLGEKSSYAITSSLQKIAEQDEIEIAGRRYVRQQRLARILGVTARTLARWNACGIGPAKITIGKTVLFDLAKLPDWLATRETAPTRSTRR